MQCNATPSIITNRIKSSVSCIIHSCDPAIVIDRAQEHKGRGFHDFCGDTRVNRFQESPMSRLDHEAERENSFSSLVAHEYVPETRNRARFLFPPLYFRRPRDRDNFWTLSDGTIGCLQLATFVKLLSNRSRVMTVARTASRSEMKRGHPRQGVGYACRVPIQGKIMEWRCCGSWNHYC